MQLPPRLDIPVSPGQLLAGRTTIVVFARVVDEILLAEPAVRLGARGQRLRNERRHAHRLAGQNLFAFEVAAISDRRQLAHARRLLDLPGHRRELAAIVADIGDLVRNDQVMLRIDHGLHM